MKLHIFRLSGHDFVHYRKIEIGANDRAVYQQSISCFIVYANFDWFLINLYMMQMCYSARIFYGLGQGVSGMGRWRLQADKFLNFYIPIPPYDEQKKIADYITDKVNHIEVEIDKRNKLIKKYQEYKKSLIYEVVTGKKEV